MPRDEGVLPSQMIRDFIKHDLIIADYEEGRIQPSTLDLTLGKTIYRINGSLTPSNGTPIEKMLDDSKYVSDKFSIERPVTLEVNAHYLVELNERPNLPNGHSGRTNPKSSTGRTDILTRTICDGCSSFDEIPLGYGSDKKNGRPLYLEITPRSFKSEVVEGLSLNQARVYRGNRANIRVPKFHIESIYRETPLLYLNAPPLFSINGNHVPLDDVEFYGNAISLHLDLSTETVAYRAEKNLVDSVDLSNKRKSRKGDFFREIEKEKVLNGKIILERDIFYLLSTKEGIFVPSKGEFPLASELYAINIDILSGRIHYAGFFDPNWGGDEDGNPVGNSATLEVRLYDTHSFVYDGQPICGLFYEYMLAEPDKIYGSKIGSHYAGQSYGPRLGKFFV